MNQYIRKLINGLRFGDDLKANSYNFFVHNDCESIGIHSLKVAEKALELSRKFNINSYFALALGIFHDIGRVIPKEDKIYFSEKLEIEIMEEERIYPEIIHGKISRVLAQEIFNTLIKKF